jgi:hypothetical protein
LSNCSRMSDLLRAQHWQSANGNKPGHGNYDYLK